MVAPLPLSSIGSGTHQLESSCRSRCFRCRLRSILVAKWRLIKPTANARMVLPIIISGVNVIYPAYMWYVTITNDPSGRLSMRSVNGISRFWWHNVAATVLVIAFALACGAEPQNAPTPEPVVVVVSATPAPTPSPTPAPTPEPTRTPTNMPTPTTTPTPTPKPTATPTLASLFDVHPNRVQPIEYPLPPGSDFAVLTGCHAHSISGSSFAFTRSGRLPSSGESDRLLPGVIIILGYFPTLARGGCYEMVVKSTGVGNYRLNFGTPVKIRQYKLVDYDDGVRRIR